MCKNEEKKQLKHCDVTSETRWEKSTSQQQQEATQNVTFNDGQFSCLSADFWAGWKQLIQNTFSVKEKCKKIIVYVSLLLIIITIITD